MLAGIEAAGCRTGSGAYIERFAKALARFFGAALGLALMSANTSGALRFHLEAPESYYADPRSLALLRAARAGDLPRAHKLVADGADPNDDGPKANQYNRLRLLHYVIAANDARAVQTLVAVGADPELNSHGFGRSFLFAMTLENLDMLSVLLDLRPISTLSKDTLQYMLFESVTQPCRPCLELFLKRGAQIDYPDAAGYTTMMRAMDAQDYDLAEWLLLQGASVLVEAKGGMTPAYSLQYDLQKFRPGTHTHNKILHMKELMEARGAVFPAPSPKEVRERRGKK